MPLIHFEVYLFQYQAVVLACRLRTRLNTNRYALTHTKTVIRRTAACALIVRVRVHQTEISVTGARPAPVEVEIVVGVVAVADKRMPAASGLTAVAYRTTFGQLVVEQADPLRIRVMLAVHVLHARVVVEIGLERVGYAYRRGFTVTEVIVHLCCFTTVFHQLGDCILLCFALAAGVGRQHVRPVEGRGRYRTDGVVRVVRRTVTRYRLASRLRPVPVFHHLRHGRRHATRRCVGGRVTVKRGKQVVRLVLVPLRLNQRSNRRPHGATDDDRRPCRRGCCVAVEHILQSVGQVVEVDVSLVGVAEDGVEVVISAYDHKTAVVFHVERIVRGGGFSFHSAAGRSHGEGRESFSPTGEEGLRLLHGFEFGNRSGHSEQGRKGEGQKGNKSSTHRSYY